MENPFKQAQTAVYIANIPSSGEIKPVYPLARQIEIENCKNEKTRREKYHAWKLLAFAVGDLERFRFEKNQNGKWQCDGFAFSLSHSKNAVAVAISKTAVGVDIELYKNKPQESVVRRIFTEEERTIFQSLNERERAEFFTRKWTEKESVFKALDLPAFFPADFTKFTGRTYGRDIAVNGETYRVCVACETPPIFYEKLKI